MHAKDMSVQGKPHLMASTEEEQNQKNRATGYTQPQEPNQLGYFADRQSHTAVHMYKSAPWIQLYFTLLNVK